MRGRSGFPLDSRPYFRVGSRLARVSDISFFSDLGLFAFAGYSVGSITLWMRSTVSASSSSIP
jgi:hypothetical protein